MTSQQAITPALVEAFAPTGTLRAAINVGNPILANRPATGGDPVGVSIDLASEFARRLGLPVELVVFEKAAASVEAVRGEQADIGFFAIDPARGEGLRFTAAYVLIEGSYLVPESSALTENAQVDCPGQRISVGSGSAYDLFLTRELHQAEIVRLQGAPAALAALRTARRGRGGRRHPAGARGRDVTSSGRTRPAWAFHGDPAGDGHAEQPGRRRAGATGRLRPGDEGERFRGRSDETPPHPRRERRTLI
ncbi:transporter substrate-binding domain-containing protein [Fodinicola feengrottensis]|uniref:transporter substrate-binding domain-containing protein n=1 Tax=Fodinicola feengrottensis TaxID=435914 RepID=UPI002443540A|nr:transporter substrate-binding domain-containing protein [Fodinicola feengrottensis]